MLWGDLKGEAPPVCDWKPGCLGTEDHASRHAPSSKPGSLREAECWLGGRLLQRAYEHSYTQHCG